VTWKGLGELKTEIDDLPDDAIVVALGRDGEAHQVFELIRAVGHDPDDFRAISLLVAFGIVRRKCSDDRRSRKGPSLLGLTLVHEEAAASGDPALLARFENSGYRAKCVRAIGQKQVDALLRQKAWTLTRERLIFLTP
jgi:hypothetical protein